MASGKVYGAEWRIQEILTTPEVPFELHGCMLTVPVERKFGSVGAVHTYVDYVCRQQRTTTPDVVVNPRMFKQAHYRWGLITMPNFEQARWAWRECVVLHEIAHHLSTGGHGPEFQKEFKNLLDTYIGPEVGWAYSVLNSGG